MRNSDSERRSLRPRIDSAEGKLESLGNRGTGHGFGNALCTFDQEVA